MLIKIFTIRFSDTLGGFDDEPLRNFMADKNIISFKDQFNTHNGIPYFLVPTLPRGNAYACAFFNGCSLMAIGMHSHAGAWERGNSNVIPAKAGIQIACRDAAFSRLDSGFRRND